MIFQAFNNKESVNLNLARIKHFKSLNLNLNNKNVLETGCGGIGNITQCLLSLNANVTLNDSRIENINFLLKTINKEIPYNNWDLNEILPDDKIFDIIFCYGTLYHLTKPDIAIKNLSKICKEYLIISTVTNGTNDDTSNILFEHNSPTQGHYGYGCRPGRQFVYNELSKNFKYVYMLKTQPNHEDFPLSFPSAHHASRNIFIGSHILLNNNLLVDYMPNTYTTI